MHGPESWSNRDHRPARPKRSAQVPEPPGGARRAAHERCSSTLSATPAGGGARGERHPAFGRHCPAPRSNAVWLSRGASAGNARSACTGTLISFPPQLTPPPTLMRPSSRCAGPPTCWTRAVPGGDPFQGRHRPAFATACVREASPAAARRSASRSPAAKLLIGAHGSAAPPQSPRPSVRSRATHD